VLDQVSLSIESSETDIDLYQIELQMSPSATRFSCNRSVHEPNWESMNFPEGEEAAETFLHKSFPDAIYASAGATTRGRDRS
jgi:hypothetical protein